MRAKQYSVFREFECEKLGGIARIKYTGIQAPDGSKGPARAHECDSCFDCGIAKRGKHGHETLHWEECVHPELRRDKESN